MAEVNSNEFHCIDSRVMDRCINQKDDFERRYAEITTKYFEIMKKIKWYGEGADAFYEDAKKVRTNLTGMGDILANMCNILKECRQIMDEADRTIGEFNRNPDQS